jgi:membrane-bound serine protease (ClpP class)
MKHFFVFVFSLSIWFSGYSQKIYYFKIEEGIDKHTQVLTDSALAKATRLKADYIIVEINTPGGDLAASMAINQLLLDYPKPTIAFINNNAYSGGAMIALACDSIYMADGGSMGAVTPIDGQTGKYASEKIRSAVRGKMRATAEKNGRNPDIAEAMVDETHEHDSVATPGKIVVYTPKEAIKNKYCEGNLNSIEEILAKNKMSNAQIYRYEPSFLEKVISFFVNPAVSSILILLIIGGIYFELQSPGIGFPLVIAIIGLVLYFVPYYIRGMAENWELLLFLGGLALVAVELLLFPGVKIAIITGLVIIFIALGLMMVGNVGFSMEGVSKGALASALIATSIGLFGSFGAIVALAPKLATSKKFSHLTLQTSQNSKEGYKASQTPLMVGKIGESYTVLRPSGKVYIDGQIFDAFTQGDFLEKNTHIVVIGQEGAELIVKSVEVKQS